MLLEDFPLSSLSFLGKISKGKIGDIKYTQALNIVIRTFRSYDYAFKKDSKKS